jgi:hypothetical protein
VSTSRERRRIVGLTELEPGKRYIVNPDEEATYCNGTPVHRTWLLHAQEALTPVYLAYQFSGTPDHDGDVRVALDSEEDSCWIALKHLLPWTPSQPEDSPLDLIDALLIVATARGKRDEFEDMIALAREIQGVLAR